MNIQTQAAFQKLFRSGVALAYGLSSHNENITDSTLFFESFQQLVAI